LGLTVFFAVQAVQAFQRFQQERKLVVTGDVSTIRSWMTVPYIAHYYRIPESYLDQSLRITSDKTVHRLPLRELADRVKRPVDGLIRDIQHAILNYRNQRSKTGANDKGQPRSAYRVRAGLAPALVLSRAGLAPALVHTPAPALHRAPALLHTPTPAAKEVT
jgi:hypothetical protein